MVWDIRTTTHRPIHSLQGLRSSGIWHHRENGRSIVTANTRNLSTLGGEQRITIQDIISHEAERNNDGVMTVNFLIRWENRDESDHHPEPRRENYMQRYATKNFHVYNAGLLFIVKISSPMSPINNHLHHEDFEGMNCYNDVKVSGDKAEANLLYQSHFLHPPS